MRLPMSQRINLSDQRFGKLTVREWVPGALRDGAWRCSCDCGGERVARGHHLTGRRIVSCGCIRPRHGGKGTRAYGIWRSMLNRVAKDLHYIERGIFVCERWKQFPAFLEDLGQPPVGATLERNDNERGYEPGNCRWATRKEQARNTRRNVRISFYGCEFTLAEWAERLGIKYWTLYSRYRAGWTPERMLQR